MSCMQCRQACCQHPACPAEVRVDTWVQTGTTVTPHYDSLIAKLMVYAESRPAAIAKLQAALAETKVTHALRICHKRSL